MILFSIVNFWIECRSIINRGNMQKVGGKKCDEHCILLWHVVGGPSCNCLCLQISFCLCLFVAAICSGEPGCWRSGGGFCSPIPLPGSTPAPRSTSCPRTPRPRQPAVDGGKPARYPSPASNLAFAGFSDFQPRSHHLLMIFFGQWVTDLSSSGSSKFASFFHFLGRIFAPIMCGWFQHVKHPGEKNTTNLSSICYCGWVWPPFFG